MTSQHLVVSASCDSHVIIWSEENYEWCPLILSHHPDKFGGYRRRAREDILFLVCHATSHATSLVISEYHANFDGHRPFGRGEIKLSIWHVTSHNRGARRSCDIMGELTLPQVAPLLSLVVTGLWNRRYKAFNSPHDLTWLAMGQFPSSEATNLSGFMAVGLT